jgi:hypothetical protein
MTTINCSSDCKHQKDGKCMLEDAISNSLSIETDCVCYEENIDKGKSAIICRPSHE